MMPPKLLTVSDIARLIGWSAQRTRRWLRRRGILPPPKGDNKAYTIPRDRLLALEESASLLEPGDL